MVTNDNLRRADNPETADDVLPDGVVAVVSKSRPDKISYLVVASGNKYKRLDMARSEVQASAASKSDCDAQSPQSPAKPLRHAAQGKSGLCQPSFVGRAWDSEDRKGDWANTFPYFPSRQERRIFQFVFFDAASNRWKQRGLICLQMILGLLNAYSHVYLFVVATQRHSFKSTTDFKSPEHFNYVIADTAAYYGMIQMGLIILNLLYFCCRQISQGTTEPVTKFGKLFDAHDYTCATGSSSSGWDSIAYQVFCARSLAHNLRYLADWNVLTILGEFDTRAIKRNSYKFTQSLYGKSKIGVLWLGTRYCIYYWVVAALAVVVIFSKLYPLKDIFNEERYFFVDWTNKERCELSVELILELSCLYYTKDSSSHHVSS